MNKDIVVTRVFNAPRERVWKAWSESDEVKKWWGPAGFTCPLANIDFRENGTSLVCMRAPAEYGGQDTYSTWKYTKIVPYDRFEYIFSFADQDGNKLTPAELHMPEGVPEAGHHVVTFKALDDNTKTEMTVTEHGYTSEQAYTISKTGLEQCLDKMAASLT